MSNKLTVLIPTSPIPAHPDTSILDETIFNTRQYTKDLIVILFDGVHSSISHRTENYQQYKTTVVENIAAGKYGDCVYFDFEHHTHQAEMTRFALKKIVRTPLVMFVEHDTSPIGDIPFSKICELVRKSREIHYVRFNIFHTILDEHKYLMLDKSPKLFNNIPLIRTIQYSARPHVAKANWYRDLLFNYFPKHSKEMIEDRLHGIVIDKYNDLGYDTFGLAIYTPHGNQLRSYHSNGRGSDEKIVIG